MSSNRDIKEAVQFLAGTNKTDTIFLIDANVDSVDQDTRTCTCTMIGGSANNQIDNVRLMPSIDDGLLIIPDIDSTVTIILSTFTEPVIIAYSGISKIILRGGDLGGLVVIGGALKSYNQLENDLNELKQLISGWIPVTGDGGASLKTLLTTWFSSKLNVTKQSDIENKNITQG